MHPDHILPSAHTNFTAIIRTDKQTDPTPQYKAFFRHTNSLPKPKSSQNTADDLVESWSLKENTPLILDVLNGVFFLLDQTGFKNLSGLSYL